jgi:hypothetical protein
LSIDLPLILALSSSFRIELPLAVYMPISSLTLSPRSGWGFRRRPASTTAPYHFVKFGGDMGAGSSRIFRPPKTSPVTDDDDDLPDAPIADCWKCRLTPGNRCKKHRTAPAPLWLAPPSPTPYYTSTATNTPPYSAPPTVGKFTTKQTLPGQQAPAPPYVTLHAPSGSTRPANMPSFSSPESGTSFYYRQPGVASPQKQVSFAPNQK